MNCDEGVLLVNKPAGFTSHDIVNLVRKKFGFRKVGHAGTLDPMATGLLVILIGGYTKRSQDFSRFDKEYRATLRLGISTDTGDAEGRVLAEKDPGPLSAGEIDRAMEAFRGRLFQLPPMYSAKKVRGKKLYNLARKGAVIDRKPAEIFIKELRVLDFSPPNVTIYVACSKGTYIRQLAHDMGVALGCGAHLAGLHRTRVGPYRVKEAVSFDRLFRRDTEGGRFTGDEKTLHENILQPA